MSGSIHRVIGAAGLALAVLAAAVGARAQPQPQDYASCMNKQPTTPDLQIAGCTAIIGQGHQTPKNLAIVFNNRANAWYRKQHYDKAMTDYDRAVLLDPQNPHAYVGRGNVYDDLGDRDHAIADYDRAIELDPDNANVFYNRGLTYRRKGDNDRALADLNQSIRLNPDYAPAHHM